MKKLKILIAIVSLVSAGQLHAQQEPMYGQYIFNNSVINPAQAGAGEWNQGGVLSRFQFVGIDGSPQTNSAYVNLRLPRKLGFSASIIQDRLGIEENLQFHADLAYHGRLSERWTLSAGLRGLVSHYSRNFSNLQNLEPDDPFFRSNVNSGVMANVGAGLLLSSDRSFLGVSMPRVFKDEMQVYDPGNYGFLKRANRHLFAYGGTNIQLSEDFVFVPSTLLRYSDDAPLQLDMNAVFSYREVFSFGPVLRSNLIESWVDAVGFLVGLRLSERWYFGYMYEYPANDMNLVTRQTHEFSLRFLWGGQKDERIRSPGYFL